MRTIIFLLCMLIITNLGFAYADLRDEDYRWEDIGYYEEEQERLSWYFDEYNRKVYLYYEGDNKAYECKIDREPKYIEECGDYLIVSAFKARRERRRPKIFVYDFKTNRFSDKLDSIRDYEILWERLQEENKGQKEQVDYFLISLVGGSSAVFYDWMSKLSVPKNTISSLEGMAGAQSSPHAWEEYGASGYQVRVLYEEKSGSSWNLVLYDPQTSKTAVIATSTTLIYGSDIEKDTVIYFKQAGTVYEAHKYDISTGKDSTLFSDGALWQPKFGGDYIVYHDGISVILYQISKNTRAAILNGTTSIAYGEKLATDGKSVIYSEAVYNTVTKKTDWHLYGYDIAAKTKKKLTTSSIEEATCSPYRPAVDGDWTVYGIESSTIAGYLEVVQISTGKTVTLKSSSQEYFNPAISGNRISYTIESAPAGNFSIAVYDFINKYEVFRASAKNTWQNDIYGTSLVFERTVNTDSDIIYKQLVPVLDQLTKGVMARTPSSPPLPPSHPNTPLVVNGWMKLEETAFSYDVGLSVLMEMLSENKEEAQKMVDYLWGYYKESITSLKTKVDANYGVYGIVRLTKDLKGQLTKAIVNGLHTKSAGQGLMEWNVNTGPMAWIGLSALHLGYSNNFIGPYKNNYDFAKEIFDNFIYPLQDINGGIRAGGDNYGSATDSGQTERFNKNSVEENLSCYYFINMLEASANKKSDTATQTKCQTAKAAITKWIADKSRWKFDTSAKPEYIYPIVYKGVSVTTQYASDVHCLLVGAGLTAATPDGNLDNLERALKSIEDHAFVNIIYKKQDGVVVDVVGVDFTDPDFVLTERSGYHPMISPEWSAEMVLAYYRIAVEFWKQKSTPGYTQKATDYKAKGDALLYFIKEIGWLDTTNDIMYMPYATAEDLETGFAWKTPKYRGQPKTSSSSNWVSYPAMLFFPSEPDGGEAIRNTLYQIPATTLSKATSDLKSTVKKPVYTQN